MNVVVYIVGFRPGAPNRAGVAAALLSRSPAWRHPPRLRAPVRPSIISKRPSTAPSPTADTTIPSHRTVPLRPRALGGWPCGLPRAEPSAARSNRPDGPRRYDVKAARAARPSPVEVIRGDWASSSRAPAKQSNPPPCPEATDGGGPRRTRRSPRHRRAGSATPPWTPSGRRISTGPSADDALEHRRGCRAGRLPCPPRSAPRRREGPGPRAILRERDPRSDPAHAAVSGRGPPGPCGASEGPRVSIGRRTA